MNLSVDFNKYCVVIPAFNAGKTISELILKVQNLIPELSIIVIDDGSTDNTALIVSEFGSVRLYSHKVNRGKGAAVKTGIRIAQKNGFQYAIFIDADLQHDPGSILEFIKTREQYRCEMILGRRNFFGTKMPFHRVLSNTITSFVISIRTGKVIHDSQCGYRLIGLENLNPFLFTNDGFQFESEFLIKMVCAGKSYQEVSIPTIYNTSGSSINNVMDTIRFIKIFFLSYFWF